MQMQALFVKAICLLLPLLPLIASRTVHPRNSLAPLRSYEPNGPLASNSSQPVGPAGARTLIATAGNRQTDSAVPVGTVIRSCTQPGTVALTFDDGPYQFTQSVLDTLQKNNVKATFFVNGENWGDITSDDSRASIQRMANEGHQIGSHTYTHADLATLDHDGIVNQMTTLEQALIGIVGFAPTYMRPPYLSTNDLVLQTLGELGYHVISCDIDTLDYNNDSEAQIQNAVQNFANGLAAGGTIELSHDVHEWTARVLVQAMIDEVNRRGLNAVTVGECLGDDQTNWYKTP